MPTRPKHVLLADDDTALCRILEMRLKTLGIDTVTCHDATQALDHIHTSPPDAIVMDIGMPAGNGLAACEMLANDDRLKDIPVIILTGRGDQATQDRIAALGARYVLKTGDLWGQLKPALKDLLGLQTAAA